MQIIKIILIISSAIGYYLYLKKKKIKEEFIPIMIVSSISITVYIAGILNFMTNTVILIGVVGIALLIKEIYSIIKHKEKIDIERYNFNSL